MFRIALLASTLLITAPASASAQSILGQWDCNGRDGPGQAIRTLQEYKAGGRLYHLANMAIGRGKDRADAAILLRGSWSAEGNVLVEKFTTARVRSVKVNGRDITKTARGKRMQESFRRRFLSRPYRTRIRSLDGTTMTFKSGGFDATCTRRQ